MGLTPRTALLVMLVVPAGTLATFCLLLRPSRHHQLSPSPVTPSCAGDDSDDDSELSGLLTGRRLTCGEKLAAIRGLLQYMIPLGLVYFFEYLINQVSCFAIRIIFIYNS